MPQGNKSGKTAGIVFEDFHTVVRLFTDSHFAGGQAVRKYHYGLASGVEGDKEIRTSRISAMR